VRSCFLHGWSCGHGRSSCFVRVRSTHNSSSLFLWRHFTTKNEKNAPIVYLMNRRSGGRWWQCRGCGRCSPCSSSPSSSSRSGYLSPVCMRWNFRGEFCFLFLSSALSPFSLLICFAFRSGKFSFCGFWTCSRRNQPYSCYISPSPCSDSSPSWWHFQNSRNAAKMCCFFAVLILVLRRNNSFFLFFILEQLLLVLIRKLHG